jgi:hypothetical protein
MNQTLVYPARVTLKVKSSTGNYQVGSLQVGIACLCVGDRIQIQSDNLSARRQYLANATGEIKAIKGNKASVLLDGSNKRRTIQIDLCSLIWISSQESEDFQKQQQQLEELGQLNLLNLIQMPNKSCDRALEISQSTQTLGTFPPELENTTSIVLDSLVSGQALQVTEPDSTTQNQACGLKPCEALRTGNPTSPSSKILRGLSVEDYEQFLEDCEWSDIVGTIHSSYRQRNLERRTSAKDFSSLPTPTTYAKGSGNYRPAGATRLEQSLRKFIAKGDKLHPAAPGWLMGFPPGWVEEILMAGGLQIQHPITPVCDRTLPNVENVTTSTPDPSVPSKLRSPSAVSSTSIPSVDELECTQELKIGDHLSTSAKCPSCSQSLISLANRCGVCETTLENFLEETERATTSIEKPKSRQRKGCLYKYLENKKLKDGTIASYPRVIEHRDPSNPHHWRWGFNWEEKVDGEWKGRSIGSVPIGAIALIQSMQNEGVPLEQIIGFIKRAKAKKSS